MLDDLEAEVVALVLAVGPLLLTVIWGSLKVKKALRAASRRLALAAEPPYLVAPE